MQYSWGISATRNNVVCESLALVYRRKESANGLANDQLFIHALLVHILLRGAGRRRVLGMVRNLHFHSVALILLARRNVRVRAHSSRNGIGLNPAMVNDAIGDLCRPAADLDFQSKRIRIAQRVVERVCIGINAAFTTHPLTIRAAMVDHVESNLHCDRDDSD